MSDEKKWHECPCGQSIAVSGSEFGQAVLAQWQKAHAAHVTDREVGSHEGHRIQESPTLTGKDVPRFCHTCEVEIEPRVRDA